MTKAPDWPPRMSASDVPDREQRHGSTGQLFEARNKQWVRIACPQCGDAPTYQTPDGTWWDSSAHYWRS